MRALTILVGTCFIHADLPAAAGPRPADFEYLGAFSLDGPSVTEAEPYAYGQRGLAYDEQDGGLWITGHDYGAQVFKIEVPKPLRSKVWQELPIARILVPPKHFISHCPSDSSWHFSGIEVLKGRLYGICKYWYNVAGANLDTFHREAPSEPLAEGPFHVGARRAPFQSSKVGAYLFSIPVARSSSLGLGNKRLVTGFSRAAGAFGGSQGPVLIAFDPDHPEDAVDLVWYRERHPQCPPEKCDFPDYSSCDAWEGATWVRLASGDAVLVAGSKGLGETRYGSGDPGDCSRYQGFHCDPFEPQVLFFSPADLAARLAGKLKPWEVLPYAVWKPEEFWSQSCGSHTGPGGMAFDQDTGRLYVVETVVGPFGKSIVHVYKGNPSVEPTAGIPGE